MPDLEQNLDAYRILAQILRDLRNSMRVQLEKHHGNEWYRVGLPEAVLDRLIERKEREKAIDWYENEYQQLVDFASFADILEVLEVNPDLMPELKTVTPSKPLLHARMMELEVMREKLAMARTISEAELAFLGTFHLRIRKALQGLVPDQDSEPVPERPPIQAVPAPVKPVEESEPEPGEAAGEQPAGEEGPKPEKAASNEEKPARPKMRTRIGRSKTFGNSKKSGSGAAAQTAIITEAELDEPEAGEEAAPASTGNALAAALDEGDSVAVLRALYKEVTTLAEGLWTSDAPPTPSVWLRVREHSWYEENFSGLGLKPLSDFYDILAKIHERMAGGLAKDELQQLLKEHSFAKVLLALRDMFQKNQI